MSTCVCCRTPTLSYLLGCAPPNLNALCRDDTLLFLQARVQQNFHDRSIPSDRPELISKYIEPLRDPLWDRGLLHFYKSLQVWDERGGSLIFVSLILCCALIWTIV